MVHCIGGIEDDGPGGAALLSGLFLPFIIVYFVLSAISWIVLIGEML